MITVAHRGVPHQVMENSFEGFELAIKNKLQRIETDIHVSIDGVPYIIHDDNLSRLTDQNVLISKTHSKDIDKIKLKDGSPIPKLSEILSKYRNQIEWNLEIKSSTIEDAEIIMKTVLKDSLHKKVIFSSFDHKIIKSLSKKFSEFEYALLWEELPSDKIIEKEMTEANCSYIHPEYKVITKEFMTLSRLNNWKVVPYISIKDEVLTKDYISSLKELELHGMCTNYPLELKNAFNRETNDPLENRNN